MSKKLIAALVAVVLVAGYVALDMVRRNALEESCKALEAATKVAGDGVQIQHWRIDTGASTGSLRLGNNSTKNIAAVVVAVYIKDCLAERCAVVGETRYNWKASVPAGQARDTVLDFSSELAKVRGALRGQLEIEVGIRAVGVDGFEFAQENCVVARDMNFLGRAMNLVGLFKAERVEIVRP